MNYKITTDFSKVKKEKCDNVFHYSGLHGNMKCPFCDGTISEAGNKPTKITYNAGELKLCYDTIHPYCSVCGKDLNSYRVFKLGDVFEPICCKGCQIKFHKIEPTKTMPTEERVRLLQKELGTGKLHPKVGDVVEICSFCNKIEAECECTPINDLIELKFLSINTKKEEAVVVQIG